jgi:hypothetical protein
VGWDAGKICVIRGDKSFFHCKGIRTVFIWLGDNGSSVVFLIFWNVEVHVDITIALWFRWVIILLVALFFPYFVNSFFKLSLEPMSFWIQRKVVGNIWGEGTSTRSCGPIIHLKVFHIS